MAVKHGLESCSTTYALVLQHDRIFAEPLTNLSTCITMMQTYPHIRYIGFPTSMSSNHDKLLTTKGLKFLNTKATLLCDSIDESQLKLQPLMFWYDSQHLAHIQRYLQIYTPYVSLSEDLRLLLTKPFINTMRLRIGDFIEDRFGQAQRKSLMAYQNDMPTCFKLFHWYGSYLLWDADCTVQSNKKTREYVVHLRGRKLDEAAVKSTVLKIGSSSR
jgi:hypothetical protein